MPGGNLLPDEVGVRLDDRCLRSKRSSDSGSLGLQWQGRRGGRREIATRLSIRPQRADGGDVIPQHFLQGTFSKAECTRGVRDSNLCRVGRERAFFLLTKRSANNGVVIQI